MAGSIRFELTLDQFVENKVPEDDVLFVRSMINGHSGHEYYFDYACRAHGVACHSHCRSIADISAYDYPCCVRPADEARTRTDDFLCGGGLGVFGGRRDSVVVCA